MNIDRHMEGIRTRSDIEKERKQKEREKLEDSVKLSMWIGNNQKARGVLQLPSDINVLPGCGCEKKDQIGKKGFSMTRLNVSLPWEHYRCPKKAKKGNA